MAINHNIRSTSWHIGSNYKEIIFDPLGGISYRPVGRSRDFPVNFVYLVGTIRITDIDLVPLLERVPALVMGISSVRPWTAVMESTGFQWTS